MWKGEMDVTDIQYGPVAGCSKHDNNPSGITEVEDLLTSKDTLRSSRTILLVRIT
jgi:hypothetical protein